MAAMALSVLVCLVGQDVGEVTVRPLASVTADFLPGATWNWHDGAAYPPGGTYDHCDAIVNFGCWTSG